MKAGAEALVIGDPWDEKTKMGPLVSRHHRDKVLGYYAKAAAEGATVVTGGGVPKMPGVMADGYWIEPTIWTGLPETATVIREEIFGPCCHISPFDSEDEVLAKANDTPYGLAATVWTADLARAHRFVRGLEAGIQWVNCWFVRDLRTPFGGAKRSGIGREGGVHSVEFYTELKNVCVKL
jgi:aminomuconate-semialdehyde/2-hydroxymuconate-6-semialdehyde dehydrogenase